MGTVLVVDAANVIGARPDGWWRDRPGAAARLHAALRDTPLDWDRVVLVLEGRAVAGVPEGTEAAITVVHAAGSGDDEVVAQCQRLGVSGETLTLATADRGLVARVEGLGPTVLGPRALRRLLNH